MTRLKLYALIAAILCVLVVVGMVASHLALTDIHHDMEPDLETEWSVVRATFILTGFLVFVTSLLARGVIQESNRATLV